MRLLWILIAVGVVAASMLQNIRAGRLPQVPATVLQALAFALIVAGLGLRWVAIVTLGRLFTVNVAIHAGHELVDVSVYRYIRHPSYAGLLVAFLGLGVSFRNWLSIAALMAPVTLAVLNRIAKEEAALRAALGDAYAAYCGKTKRLVPWVV